MCAGEYCKIGISYKNQNRKKEIQTGNPILISNEYYSDLISNPTDVENLIHKKLKKYQSNGEWFKISFEIAVDTVKKFIKKYGDFNLIKDEQPTREEIKKIVESFFPNENECDEYMPKINLDRWEPKESEEESIKSFIYDSFVGSMDLTGGDYEICKDDIKLYNLINHFGIVACKEDIQEFFVDYYWAVNGYIYKYYKNEDILRLIELTILDNPAAYLPQRSA